MSGSLFAGGAPCIVCGHACTERRIVPRPHFPLPQPTPERQASVYGWLAATPPHAAVCLMHFRHFAPLPLGDRVQAIRLLAAELWFQRFGYPLKLERRPARRTPVAIAATPEREEEVERAADRRRRARRRGHPQLRRLAYSIRKFAYRGVRQHRQ